MQYAPLPRIARNVHRSHAGARCRARERQSSLTGHHHHHHHHHHHPHHDIQTRVDVRKCGRKRSYRCLSVEERKGDRRGVVETGGLRASGSLCLPSRKGALALLEFLRLRMLSPRCTYCAPHSVLSLSPLLWSAPRQLPQGDQTERWVLAAQQSDTDKLPHDEQCMVPQSVSCIAVAVGLLLSHAFDAGHGAMTRMRAAMITFLCPTRNS
eukprot:399283-Rhodomonas_salina.5